MTSRIVTIALLAAVAAALWFYHGVAARYGLFGGTLALALDIAASAATAVLVILAAAELIAALVIPVFTAARPTGFERAGAYLVFTLAAFVAVLAHFGVNVTAVLTTSAVFTAIIGLALQPTLGAFIAGFTLNADRVLKVGDGLVRDGETFVVTAIGWRSVVCTRGDGTRTVLSNSRVLDGAVDIVPGDGPLRAELFIVAPLSIEPQRIAASIAEAIAELPSVDLRREISVEPASLDPDKAQARYRIRYWVRSRHERETSTGQALARIWYAFQREAIAWPGQAEGGAAAEEWRPSLVSRGWIACVEEALKRATADDASSIDDDLSLDVVGPGSLLLYGHDERIVLPERVVDCRFLVVRGVLREEWSGDGDRQSVAGAMHRVARRGELARLAGRLARVIGPYAEVAVARAALDEPSLVKVRDAAAREIDDEAERKAFIDDDCADPNPGLDIGFVFVCRRNAEGRLQPHPPLRAEGEVALVALPGAQGG